LVNVAARRVRNSAGAGLVCHCAGRVRNLLLAGFCYKRARCVWHLLCRVYRNLTADRVRNLLVADFRNHASAGDRLLNHLRAPFAAADRPTWALHAHFFGAAGIAGINDAFLHNRAGNMTCFRDPFATAFLDRFAFSDWFADGITDILVAGFCFGAVRCAAHVLIAGIIHWPADIVANCAMAGLVHWFADRVALFAVTGLIDWLADVAGDVTVARLIDRLADIARDSAVAGLIHRFADRVTFIAVARIVDVPHA